MKQLTLDLAATSFLGADIGPEDHADRLAERQKARRREANEHDRRRAGRLQHRGDTRPDEKRLDAVAGQRRENVPEARARGALQAFADEAHPIEQERGAAEQGEEDEVGVAHVRASIEPNARW